VDKKIIWEDRNGSSISIWRKPFYRNIWSVIQKTNLHW